MLGVPVNINGVHPSVPSIMNELFKKYNMEGVVIMSYTMRDYMRDYVKTYFPVLAPDEMGEVLKGIPDKRLKGIPVNEIVKTMTNAERKKMLKLLYEAESSEKKQIKN